MIGLGPHTMSGWDWAFWVGLNFALPLLAIFAVWLAAGRPRLIWWPRRRPTLRGGGR